MDIKLKLEDKYINDLIRQYVEGYINKITLNNPANITELIEKKVLSIIKYKVDLILIENIAEKIIKDNINTYFNSEKFKNGLLLDDDFKGVLSFGIIRYLEKYKIRDVVRALKSRTPKKQNIKNCTYCGGKGSISDNRPGVMGIILCSKCNGSGKNGE